VGEHNDIALLTFWYIESHKVIPRVDSLRCRSRAGSLSLLGGLERFKKSLYFVPVSGYMVLGNVMSSASRAGVSAWVSRSSKRLRSVKQGEPFVPKPRTLGLDVAGGTGVHFKCAVREI
jgi:hypothetical protein